MRKELTLAQMHPLITETLASGGVFTLYPKGTSMLPLLRQGQDAVELIPADRVGAGDIILYRRDNGDYSLHRVVRAARDGYVLCGDNQYKKEPGIRPDQIIAKVGAILRDGQRVELTRAEYLGYVRSLPARRTKKVLRAYAAAAKRKLFGK